jgi:alkylation response protein AidB-like acyl-CoA dehydrogenase
MSREPWQWISYDALTQAAAADAAARDDDGAFPAAAFDRLGRLGVISNPPLQPAEAAQLLRVLAAMGRGNLSVGRIFEGHVNALLLIQLFGDAAQRTQYQTFASGGALFGIWNTDLPGSPVVLDSGDLRGKKSFASGVDDLDYALITASMHEGRQMVMVPVRHLPVDRAWWRPLGMHASGSHVIDLAGIRVQPDSLLCSPDDYIKEPWFSAGAIRFAAVNVGGMHAVLDTAALHLRETKRRDDPHQRHRLGQMAIEVETGYAWLEHAARFWASMDRREKGDVIAPLTAARLAIERAALNVLELAERSVGTAGMIRPHALERWIRDLRTYLRQPNPDAASAAVGAALSDGSWHPGS